MKKQKANADVRERLLQAKEMGIYAYNVADELRVSESTFMKWLRHELDEEKRGKVLLAINNLMSA